MSASAGSQASSLPGKGNIWLLSQMPSSHQRAVLSSIGTRDADSVWMARAMPDRLKRMVHRHRCRRVAVETPDGSCNVTILADDDPQLAATASNGVMTAVVTGHDNAMAATPVTVAAQTRQSGSSGKALTMAAAPAVTESGTSAAAVTQARQAGGSSRGRASVISIEYDGMVHWVEHSLSALQSGDCWSDEQVSAVPGSVSVSAARLVGLPAPQVRPRGVRSLHEWAPLPAAAWEGRRQGFRSSTGPPGLSGVSPPSWLVLRPEPVQLGAKGLSPVTSLLAAAAQHRAGRHFWLELEPSTLVKAPSSLRLLASQPGVLSGTLDWAKYDGGEHWRPRSFLTNSALVWRGLRDCSEPSGSFLSGGVAPPAYLRRLVGLIRQSLFEEGEQLSLTEGGEDEEEADEEGEDEAPQSPDVRSLPPLTDAQKGLVKRVHNNLGHPSRDQFLRALRASGALAQVLHYVKTAFRCSACEALARPTASRRAALPRTFALNRIIAVDLFFVAFQSRQIPFLNVVDHGTNFQLVAALPFSEGPTAAATWAVFARLWLRIFGPPEILISDGGPEFRGEFERHLEQQGSFHHVTDADSPWQNGRCERHGGWMKDLLQKGVEEGLVSTAEELDLLACEAAACKNRYFNRGGFSPYQLVFGTAPRLPHDLLADGFLDRVGAEDLKEPATDADTAAAQFARQHSLRQEARRLLFEHAERTRVASATKAAPHRDRSFTPGQWVYVWRRCPPASGRKPYGFQRDRWVGPGLVVQQYRTTVWVAMRGRLWKCSSEQLRFASHEEALGAQFLEDPDLAELLRKVGTGATRSGVEVGREGPPPAEAWDQGVDRQEEGAGERTHPVQPDPPQETGPVYREPPPGLRRSVREPPPWHATPARPELKTQAAS